MTKPYKRRTDENMLVGKYLDDEGTEHFRLVKPAKFTEERQRMFLEEYAKHGVLKRAATYAGVNAKIINEHLKISAEFNEAMAESLMEYRAKLLLHQQDLVFNGETEKFYDKEGNLIRERTRFPQRLIELELKKHDEGYRDHRFVKMDVTGGVMVAPANMSIDEWEKEYSGKTIEGKAEPDEDKST